MKEEQEDILGVVQFVKASQQAGGIEFCRLRPTHAVRADTWQPITNPRLAFPDQGFVFWFRPKANASLHQGATFVFRVTEQPHYDPSANKHDRFQVLTDALPISPTEAIVLPGIDSPKQLRRKLASGPIQLSNVAGGRVLIRIPGTKSHWLGPFPLQHVPSAGSESIAILTVPNGFVQIREISDIAFQDVEILGSKHRLLRPERQLPGTSAQFDVQNDVEVFRSLLKRIKKWDPRAFEGLEASRKIVETFDVALSSAPVGDEERSRERARIEAAHSIVEDLQREFDSHSDLAEFLIQDLLEQPVVQESLDSRLREEREKRLLEVQSEVAAQLAEARNAVTQVREEERNERQKLNTLKKEMSAAVEQILSNSVPRLTEHFLMQAVMQRKPQSSVVEDVEGDDIEIRELRSLTELRSAIANAAAASYVDPYVLGLLTCLISGSGMVVVGGAAAERTTTAVAKLLASGNAKRVSIAPTIFGISDLLKSPCAPVIAGTSSVTTLGDFLERSSTRDRLAVVILQGCNRAPPENVMFELVEAASARRPKQSFAWIDQNSNNRTTTVDGRILFLGTLTGGAATFPVPRSMQHRIPIIWADRDITQREARAASKSDVPSRISVGTWESLDWRSSSVNRDVVTLFREKLAFADDEIAMVEYVGRVATLMGDPDLGMAEALAALLVGRCEKDVIQVIAARLSQKASAAFVNAVSAGAAEMAQYFEGARFS